MNQVKNTPPHQFVRLVAEDLLHRGTLILDGPIPIEDGGDIARPLGQCPKILLPLPQGCFRLSALLLVFDALQRKAQLGRQLLQQLEFLRIERAGVLRIHRHRSQHSRIVNHRHPSHGSETASYRPFLPGGKSWIGGRIMTDNLLPCPNGGADRSLPHKKRNIFTRSSASPMLLTRCNEPCKPASS